MKISNWKLPSFLVYVLASQAIACITLVLDIPIARQVLGILYLTFIPGFVLLRGFRLEKSSMAETILFSVGLSITFLMFIGLLVNELGSSIFISKPLSTEPLAIIINITVTLMCVLSCLSNKDFNIMVTKGLRIPPLIVPYLVLPLLSVTGVILVNAFKNNLLLISVIIVISILFLLCPFYSKLSLYYPLVLVSIALALLLNTSLISKYMYGYDINLEYYVFKTTKENLYWNRNLDFSTLFDQIVYNSMLSITILPTIFSNLLNIDGTWILKIIYPLILSLLLLGIYELYRIQWGKKVAFISSIFFLSNSVFIELLSNAKQLIAELFYVLLFLILLKKSMNYRSRWITILCFVFALVVSHYGVSYIFLFLVFSTWLFGKIFVKNRNMKINLAIVALSFSFTFLWYMYIVSGPFDVLMLLFRRIFDNFVKEFFYAEARGEVTLTALGILESPSFFHHIGRILHNVTEFFILIGFVSLLVKWKKERLNSEYFLVISLNMVLLFLAIIVPRFAGALEMGRLYHVTLIFLSPLFVLGGKTFFRKVLNLKKEKTKEGYCLVLISIVLVAFFLFQTGFVYEITGDPFPSSISLSLHKMEDSMALIHESDVFGATWLSKYGDVKHMRTYSDSVSFYHVLTSYSTINRNMITIISNTTMITSPSYIYLRQFNVINGILFYNPKKNIQYNISEIPIFNSTAVFNNKINSNSACEIYYCAP